MVKQYDTLEEAEEALEKGNAQCTALMIFVLILGIILAVAVLLKLNN